MRRERINTLSRAAGTKIAAGLIAALGLAGCSGGQGPDAGEAATARVSGAALSESQIEIRAGRGITFRTLAGAPVDSSRLVVDSGVQNLRFRVRRSLKGLKDERLSEVYAVGSCRIRFESVPGTHYEVVAEPFSSVRMVYGDRDEKGTARYGSRTVRDDVPKGEEKEMIGVAIKVLDRDTLAQFLAPPDACEIKLDCRKVDRARIRPGEECAF